MKQVENGDTVKVHFRGTLDDGKEFSSSMDKEPLEFKVGDGDMIPGFEKGVVGMAAGDKKEISLEPGEAFGERREELVSSVPKEQFPENITPEIGMPLQVKNPDGHVSEVLVTGITEDAVRIDANHPLAGQNLNFEIEMVEIGE